MSELQSDTRLKVFSRSWSPIVSPVYCADAVRVAVVAPAAARCPLFPPAFAAAGTPVAAVASCWAAAGRCYPRTGSGYTGAPGVVGTCVCWRGHRWHDARGKNAHLEGAKREDPCRNHDLKQKFGRCLAMLWIKISLNFGCRLFLIHTALNFSYYGWAFCATCMQDTFTVDSCAKGPPV